MKPHVWRPLYVVLGVVALILVARMFIVPSDFGVGERGYMYSYHRKGNEQEWKDFTAKFKTAVYCSECHEDQTAARVDSPHGIIECENCHGLAGNHPDDPEALAIDTSRELCLRCHALLHYPGTDRGSLIGIEPAGHNPGEACVDCHDPHQPSLEEM